MGGANSVGEPKEENKLAGPRPASERGCTDVLCLGAFIAFWVGMLVICGLSVSNGDINAITYGADYKGNRCGVGEYADRPRTIYPRIEEDLYEQRRFIQERKPWLIKLYGLCVRGCTSPSAVKINDRGVVKPTVVENYHWVDGSSSTAVDGRPRWQLFLPEVEVLNRCFPYANEENEETIYCFKPTCKSVGQPCALKGDGDDRSWELKSSLTQEERDQCEVVKRVTDGAEFFPYQQSAMREFVTGQLGSFLGFIEAMNVSRLQIGVCSLVFTFVLCYTWMIAMRFVARIVIYLMLVLMFVVLSAAVAITFTYACFLRNDEVYNCTAAEQRAVSYAGVTLENTDVFRAGFFVCLVFWIFYVLSIIKLQRAIETCIAIVKESSVVVGHMPTLMTIPFGATALAVGVFAYFTYISIYIATAGQDDYEEFQRQFDRAGGYASVVAQDNTNTQYFLFCYHLFGTLWSLSFLVGTVCMIVAGGVAQWFFFRDDKDQRSTFPILASAQTTFRYHLGTVAFGSLLIAICQMLRILLEYIDQRSKSLQESNLVARLVLRCVKCCMWCLEKCLKFITGYAYIYTAIEGMGFCNAAKSTFVLIMKYPAQVYINHMVQFILKLLQSVTVPLMTGIYCYYWVREARNPQPMYAALICIIISFFVTRIFASVYEVIIESIFVCAFRDRDKYDAVHTPASIRKAFGMDQRAGQRQPLKANGQDSAASPPPKPAPAPAQPAPVQAAPAEPVANY